MSQRGTTSPLRAPRRLLRPLILPPGGRPLAWRWCLEGFWLYRLAVECCSANQGRTPALPACASHLMAGSSLALPALCLDPAAFALALVLDTAHTYLGRLQGSPNGSPNGPFRRQLARASARHRPLLPMALGQTCDRQLLGTALAARGWQAVRHCLRAVCARFPHCGFHAVAFHTVASRARHACVAGALVCTTC